MYIGYLFMKKHVVLRLWEEFFAVLIDSKSTAVKGFC